jgi:hypothetical protein
MTRDEVEAVIADFEHRAAKCDKSARDFDKTDERDLGLRDAWVRASEVLREALAKSESVPLVYSRQILDAGGGDADGARFLARVKDLGAALRFRSGKVDR